MKYLLLLLLPVLCFGQTLTSITPAIATTEIDSIVVTASSSTVYSVTKPFSGITKGMTVGCNNNEFPLGTYVVSNTNDSILVLSNTSDSTVALDSLRFAKFTNLQYSAGDALGFPFRVNNIHRINNVVVVDGAKQITAVKLIFFNGSFTPTEDNLAFAVSDADAFKIMGYLSLATSEVFTNNQLVTGAATTLPINLGNTVGNAIWCQLVCVGTPTFTAVNNLRVNILGE